jgi:hypothetical protein
MMAIDAQIHFPSSQQCLYWQTRNLPSLEYFSDPYNWKSGMFFRPILLERQIPQNRIPEIPPPNLCIECSYHYKRITT